MAMTHGFRKGSKVMVADLPECVTTKGIGYTLKELSTTVFTVDQVWDDLEAIELLDTKEDGRISCYIFTPEQLELAKGN